MINSFFDWMFGLPGWIQLGIASVWFYLLVGSICWQVVNFKRRRKL